MVTAEKPSWVEDLAEDCWTRNSALWRSPVQNVAAKLTTTVMVFAPLLMCAPSTQATPVQSAQIADQTESGLPAVNTQARAAVNERASGTNTSDSPSTGEIVRWLHTSSGLTWDQLGRLFGVSRRSVHMWANGARMNATNVETLHEIAAFIREHGDSSPEDVRNAVLSPGIDGISFADQLRSRRNGGSRDVSGPRHSPDFYLGARHGDVAEP